MEKCAICTGRMAACALVLEDKRVLRVCHECGVVTAKITMRL